MSPRFYFLFWQRKLGDLELCGYPILFAFHDRRSSATKGVQHQALIIQPKFFYILSYQVRWKGEDKTVPVMDWQIQRIYLVSFLVGLWQVKKGQIHMSHLDQSYLSS